MNEDSKEKTKPEEIRNPNDPNVVMQRVVQSMLPGDLRPDISQKDRSIASNNPQRVYETTGIDPKFLQKPIRTFEKDMAEAMAKKKAGETPEVVVVKETPKETPVVEEKKVEVAPDPNTIMQHVMQRILPSDIVRSNPFAPPVVEKPKPDTGEKSIRTYESDMAETLAKKKASSATIAIAENTKKAIEPIRAQEPGKSHTKQALSLLIGLLLIFAGISGGYQLYKKSAFARPYVEPKPIVIPGIVPSDRNISLMTGEAVLGNQFISQIHSQLRKEVSVPGKILEFSISEITAPAVAKKPAVIAKMTASSFIEHSHIAMPDIIQRSTTDRWMLGAYTEETGQKTLFIALSTNFFQNVFAGMLAWEKTMPEDLSVVFNYGERVQGTFSDKVIRNRDVREFRNTDGELVLLYSLINKETFIITTTESAFIAIIDRIEKQTYVR